MMNVGALESGATTRPGSTGSKKASTTGTKSASLTLSDIEKLDDLQRKSLTPQRRQSSPMIRARTVPSLHLLLLLLAPRMTMNSAYACMN